MARQICGSDDEVQVRFEHVGLKKLSLADAKLGRV